MGPRRNGKGLLARPARSKEGLKRVGSGAGRQGGRPAELGVTGSGYERARGRGGLLVRATGERMWLAWQCQGDSAGAAVVGEAASGIGEGGGSMAPARAGLGDAVRLARLRGERPAPGSHTGVLGA